MSSTQLVPTVSAPLVPAAADSWRARPSDSPAVRLQQMIFRAGTDRGASDIHIEPSAAASRVRFRVNGLMQPGLVFPGWMHDSLLVRIKVLGRMDIAERRVPQDGQIHEDSTGADYRVSTLPTVWGEKAVIRILRHSRRLLSLDELGILGEDANFVRSAIDRHQGIFLVVGPTGSGKTTTLYACIRELIERPLNIVTIEDPVEFDVDGLTQVTVNEKAGLHFASALRSILRQDPDVILVGEIRDAETARIAYQAALTGHLVLSTLHATDGITAVLRLRELGVEPGLIGSTTAGVVAQRLLRINCPNCRSTDSPQASLLRRLGIPGSQSKDLRRGTGCPACASTGVSGRKAVIECLEMKGLFRERLADGSESELRRAARSAGLTPLVERAVELVLRGEASADDAYHTCYCGEA